MFFISFPFKRCTPSSLQLNASQTEKIQRARQKKRKERRKRTGSGAASCCLFPTAMGFPLGYSDILLPKLIFHAFSFVGLIQNLLCYLLSHLGLSHLLESEPLTPDQNTHLPPSQSISAILIREILPVVKFQEVVQEPDVPESCAVCLCEFEGHQEIRRLTNCLHIFHRTCLDPWLDHDHKTCPLCRTLFVPEPLQDDFNQRLWEAAGFPDYYGQYSSLSPSL